MNEPVEPASMSTWNIGTANTESLIKYCSRQLIAAHPDALNDEKLMVARARMRVAMTEASSSPESDLHRCTPASWATAIAKSAMTGLYPGGNAPSVYLIPRINKKIGPNGTPEVNWQLAWRGAVDLAERVGWTMRPELVYEGDVFEYELGEEPRILVHKPLGERSFPTPAQEWDAIDRGYVVCRGPAGSGIIRFAVLSHAGLQKRRDRAEMDMVWSQWPAEMCLSAMCKYAINRVLVPRSALASFHEAEAVALPEVPRVETTRPVDNLIADVLPQVLPAGTIAPMMEAPAGELSQEEMDAIMAEEAASEA